MTGYGASATLARMDKGAHRLAPGRLRAAMEAAGFKGRGAQRQLALAVRVDPTQVGLWLAEKTTPTGENLRSLCKRLGVSTGYLFGEDSDATADRRAAVLDDVRRLFGRAEAEALEHMARVTPHHKAILSGRIVGWVEALEEMEKAALPVTPFDLERERLSKPTEELEPVAESSTEDAEPAAVAAAPPSDERR
jgi:transcriptional regulator with XRE-family HTH domain